MASRKRDKDGEGCLFVIVGVLGLIFAIWLHDVAGVPIYAGVLLVVALALLLAWLYRHVEEEKLHAIEVSNIDLMSGVEFEHYLQKLLGHQGFSTTETPRSGDLGVDLVAKRGKEKIAIQAKRYDKKVSRRAISDAVAGMQYYDCNRAMVITNNYFTPGAEKLAQSTDCTLIDRDSLAEWIMELQDERTNSA